MGWSVALVDEPVGIIPCRSQLSHVRQQHCAPSDCRYLPHVEPTLELFRQAPVGEAVCLDNAGLEPPRFKLQEHAFVPLDVDFHEVEIHLQMLEFETDVHGDNVQPVCFNVPAEEAEWLRVLLDRDYLCRTMAQEEERGFAAAVPHRKHHLSFH